jgi:endonuclease III-like uncharacterized protein
MSICSAGEFVIDQYSMRLVTRGQLTIYQSYRIRQKNVDIEDSTVLPVYENDL